MTSVLSVTVKYHGYRGGGDLNLTLGKQNHELTGIQLFSFTERRSSIIKALWK